MADTLKTLTFSVIPLIAIIMFSQMLRPGHSFRFSTLSYHARRGFLSTGSSPWFGSSFPVHAPNSIKRKKGNILYAKRRRSNKNKEEVPEPRTDPGWVTVRLGSEEDRKRAEMNDRIQDAEQWISKKLTDAESAEINRKLGIEAEVLAALAAEDEEDEDEDRFDSSSKQKGKQSREKRGDEQLRSRGKDALRRLKEGTQQELPELQELARLRGFLEINPFLCPGCGTAFQTKSPENPGFLPKEKFKEHRVRTELIREKQEAVRILSMAGMDVNSAAAEELLREAGMSQAVIDGVKALGERNVQDRIEADTESMVNFEEDEEDVDDDSYYLQDFEDDDDEEFDEDDPLDGLEIGLDELFSQASADDTTALNAASDGSGSSSSSSSVSTGSGSGNDELQHVEDTGGIDHTSIMDASQGGKLRNMPAIDMKQYQDRYSQFTNSKSTPKHDGEGGSVAPAVKSAADDICICQRCFRLQQYGQVEESLRPGWSDNELLTPERFETLLKGIKEKPAVVLCLVDIFDLRGSLLSNLRQIVGNNPLVIAANKVDLLPKDVSLNRLKSWIHTEVKHICGYHSPRDRPPEDQSYRQNSFGYEQEEQEEEEEDYEETGGLAGGHSTGHSSRGRSGYYARKRASQAEREAGILRQANVHLVSCQTGLGMDKLLMDLMSKGREQGDRIYVMGAANVGKSSFINRLLETAKERKITKHKHSKSGKNKSPMATVSNLPGTTLDFLKIKLPNGITMIDTPGLLNKGQLTSKLTPAELRDVIPVKPVKSATLRVSEGKCVLIGGLAKVELVSGKPFFFTFFVSNDVKLHPTDSGKADEFVQKHVGNLVSPPASPERLAELGPFVSEEFEIDGEGWRKSGGDIVIAGLGWVSVTGVGVARVRITVPEGTTMDLRPALLPYEAPHTTVKFTGGRLARKSSGGGSAGGGGRAKGSGNRSKKTSASKRHP
mmetsp:Transcript_15461/g.25871  ORF Transcript_15461/g.25871 Transcript_15461/m.25871 type:complete len:949 (-) Transcript_15461:68-2914(-)